MIVKMKFINISGPRNDIDRVTDLYLSRYEIQLESALSELKTVDNLRPFVEINPYKDALGKAEEFAGYLENADEISPDTSLGLDDIFELIRTTNEAYLKIQAKKEKLKKETETLANKQKLIEPFRPLDGELDRILRYKYINYRFGRIPVEQYGRLEKYLIDDLGAIFVKGDTDFSGIEKNCIPDHPTPNHILFHPENLRKWMLYSVPCILKRSPFRMNTPEHRQMPARN